MSVLFVLCSGILTPCLSAVTATFTSSDQNVTFTGLGGTGGVGQSRITFGTCTYDGSSTTCVVTAPYTGVGGGGTLTETLNYPGNGPSPLTGTSVSAGSDLIYFGLSAGSFVVSLKYNSTGETITYLSQAVTMFFTPSATCTGGVSNCSVGQVGLVPGATISGRVSGTFDATPVVNSIITAGNYGAFSTVAPSTWMEIYGANLANVNSQTWSGDDFKGTAAPTALARTSVTIGGQPAYVYYISPSQLDVQVPSNVATGTQPVVVTTPGGSSLVKTVTVNAAQPGLLSPAAFKLAAGQYVTALFPDNKTFVLPPGAISSISSARAKPGDTIILYGVGFGPVTPDIPAGQIVTASNRLAGTLQVTIGGAPATVSFSGLAGNYLGLYQVNVVVPNVPAGDAVPLAFTLNGVPGEQKLVLAIGN